MSKRVPVWNICNMKISSKKMDVKRCIYILENCTLQEFYVSNTYWQEVVNTHFAWEAQDGERNS